MFNQIELTDNKCLSLVECLTTFISKKRRWKYLGYVLKNEVRASAVASMLLGSWKKLKGLAQGIYQRNEQTENLWDLATKDVQIVAEHTQGLLSPADTPKVI